MNVPSDLKYTESNEWVRPAGKNGTVGISDFAQSQLSDIVFAEIVVAVGDTVKKGDTIATVESVKAAADVYAPLSGKIVNINDGLGGSPELINTDPYGAAWLVEIELADGAELNQLMDAASYEKHCDASH